MKTVNADATLDPQPVVDNSTASGILTTIPPQYTMASIINIPPQIATTVCWVAVGVAIGWWLFRPSRSQVQR